MYYSSCHWIPHSLCLIKRYTAHAMPHATRHTQNVTRYCSSSIIGDWSFVITVISHRSLVIGYRSSVTRYPQSAIQHAESNVRHPTSSMFHWPQKSRHPTPFTGHRVLIFRYSIPSAQLDSLSSLKLFSLAAIHFR